MKLRITALFTAVCLLLPVGANQAFVSVRAMEDSPSLSDNSQIQAEATIANWKLAVIPDPSTGVTEFLWGPLNETATSFVSVRNDDTKESMSFIRQNGTYSVYASLISGNYTATLYQGDSSSSTTVDTVKFKVGETKKWTYCSVLPTGVSSANAQIEYNTASTKVAAQSPGDGWVKGALAKTAYENSGAPYETFDELPTSDTRVLISHYYFHFCGPSTGSDASYGQTGPYVHWDALNANDVYVANSGASADSRHPWYQLKWNGTDNWAYCQSGVSCNGSNGTHGQRSCVWYRCSTYQDRIAVNYYNYTYASNTWSASNPATGASCVRYTALAVSPTETTAPATTATTLATTATTLATTATTRATTATTRATTATTRATTATTRTTTTTTITTTATTTAVVPKDSVTTIEWGKDNWNFNNSAIEAAPYYGGFTGKTFRGQISSSYQQKLAASLNNHEYQLIFRCLEPGKPGYIDYQWGGSCYGMTTTALLAKYGYLPYGHYQTGAQTLHELPSPIKNMDVSSLITYYQLLQLKDGLQQERMQVRFRSHETNIRNILSEIDKHTLVNVCFKKDGWGGHSIMAYGYRYSSWTFNNVTYDGCIYILDPNSSVSQDDYFNIYFNSKTFNWIIPAYGDDDISSTGGAVFTLTTGNVNELNAGGYLSGTNISSNESFIARIDAAAIASDHHINKMEKDVSGYSISSAAPGEIIADTMYLPGGESTGIFGYNLHDANAAYEVAQDTAQTLDLSIRYEDCLLSGSSAAGKDVLFDKKGYVSVESENAAFDISMTFDADYPTDWFSISASGMNTCQASMEKADNGYILTADNLSDVHVAANNRTDDAEVRFSADTNKVLLYEIDPQTIGVMIDSDNNGTFDTKIAESEKVSATLGDVTGDGSINAKDANAILIAAAKLGTGKDSGLTAAQNTAADVNGDGMINAKDANIVLRYAAAIGTGSTAKLTDFI